MSVGPSLGIHADANLEWCDMKKGPKNVLMLGGKGFAGQHMGALLEPEHRVFAFGRDIDIRKPDAISRVVALSNPDWVVNFASITTVRETFADPTATYDIAIHGTLNLLAALKRSGFSGRVLNISSSEVYGHPLADELPISESSTLRPMSPYSVAKVAVEYLCFQWCQTEGIEIVTARPFTHIGPGQSDRFALASFTRQIAEIELGLREPIMRIGDLSSTRDFTDVRDTVRAYSLLLQHGVPGEAYNVCSGIETSVRDILDRLLVNAAIPIRVETDTSMLRNAQQQRLCGNYAKLAKATGWQPTIGIDQSLADSLAYWRKKLQ